MGFLERVESAGRKFRAFKREFPQKASRVHRALEPFADALGGGSDAGIRMLTGQGERVAKRQLRSGQEVEIIDVGGERLGLSGPVERPLLGEKKRDDPLWPF